MSKKPVNPAAFQKLVEILEEAIDAQADFVTIEYASGGGLEFSLMKGNTGIGGFIRDSALAEGIMMCVERRMAITLRGEERSISARRYDSFGECAFELRIGKRRTKCDKEG